MFKIRSSELPLEPGEEIIMTCRRHWLVYVLNTIALLALFIAPYVLYRLMGLATTISITGKFYDLAVFFYIAWFLILWTYFFIVWTDIYLDAWIITDRRIIDIEQQKLFHRAVSDFRIEKIQNVTIREMGFIANMLGYGSIHVETAGEKEELYFDNLPNPYQVRDTINETHGKCLARLERAGVTPEAREIITEH